MHTIRYRGCIAQQDYKTLDVFVRKLGACPKNQYPCDKRLSGKELRTFVMRYLREVMGNG